MEYPNKCFYCLIWSLNFTDRQTTSTLPTDTDKVSGNMEQMKGSQTLIHTPEKFTFNRKTFLGNIFKRVLPSSFHKYKVQKKVRQNHKTKAII